MKFSLIVATLGRKEEVRRLFDSLKNQTYKTFEVIVVDQNDTDYIKNMCDEYSIFFKIKYIHSHIKGLSKARNKGLLHADGDIIAFPDDDCTYPKDILLKVVREFYNDKGIHIISCKSWDSSLNCSSNGRWKDYSTEIKCVNVLSTCISYTVFISPLKREDLCFDEKLGVGEYFGSAEESDLILSLINKGYKGKYINTLKVFHPDKKIDSERAYNYSLGYGAVIKKEIVKRNNIKFIVIALIDILIKPTAGMYLSFIKLDIHKMKVYRKKLLGRIIGFKQYT